MAKVYTIYECTPDKLLEIEGTLEEIAQHYKYLNAIGNVKTKSIKSLIKSLNKIFKKSEYNRITYIEQVQ